MRKQLILTLGLCFVVGVGLARTIAVVHASKCDHAAIHLQLEAIEGDGDPTLEQEFWTTEATIINDPPICMRFDTQILAYSCLELEP